ncbi:penicillin-binding protein, transpeptidase domain protein [Enterococcus faecalis]|nr:penicillin-binding protein, transpeptidase domain protein [Enterococcus faecalis]OSH31773.1 penicillin-binding protein, transpeptidase domain protein [Enterococcus faecalis]OSH40946.1 penicillin-binding protein, transpeptidase domain protein [Enterococcus faecalis]
MTAWLLKFTITAVKKREKVKRTSEFRSPFDFFQQQNN